LVLLVRFNFLKENKAEKNSQPCNSCTLTCALEELCFFCLNGVNVEDHNEAQFEFSQITSQIYIGNGYCCQNHFDENLKNLGITADLALEDEGLEVIEGLDYSLRLPVADDEAPNVTQFRVGVDFLDNLIKAGEKVYVHSGKGYGRAPTMVAAYFIHAGMEVDGAVEKIKASRPEVHLVLPQIEALRSFSKRSKN
jgi:hypothetical protein